MIRRRRALGSLATVLAFGVLLPASAAEITPEEPVAAPPAEAVDPGEAVYHTLTGLPIGATDPGADGVAGSAIALAATLRAVPLDEGSTRACPEDRLTVSWEEPGPGYGHGALVRPVGPAPGATTTEVNGVVVCAGAPWAFMGFEARYVGGRWDVVAVPFVDEHVDDHDDHDDHDDRDDAGDHAGHDAHEGHDVAPAHAHAAPAPAAPVAVPAALAFGGPIEGYARYEPQRTCSPTAKPGTLELQRFLLQGAPGSRSLGISRGCSIGGSSEHKEGRAFDWGVLVTRPAERAAAEDFLARILATDEAGNRHALARRMGVMYVIWDRQIWSAYRPEDGWRPYSGRSPHTDHVHISLSWDGALGRTSFWSGRSVEGVTFGTQPVGTATRTVVEPSAPSAPTPAALPAPPPIEAPRRDPEADEEARRAQQAAEQAARQQQKAAEEAARQQQKAAEEAARQQQKAAEEAARQQQKAAEDAARHQQKAAEEEARRREQAAREQERQVRQAAAPGTPAHAGGPPGGGGGPATGNGRGKGG